MTMNPPVKVKKSQVLKGSKHSLAKLQEWQVVEIRTRAAAGETTCKLAREYEISIAACSNIINRKTWKHLTERSGDSVIHSEEYHIWNTMLQRCRNPKHISYKEYGGRGITVDEAWNNFKTFLKDMGKRPSKGHSLDRLDPNKGYGPNNVVWATSKDQARNKRKSLFLEHPFEVGKIIPAAEVAELLGITYQQLRYRYKKEGKWPSTETK